MSVGQGIEIDRQNPLPELAEITSSGYSSKPSSEVEVPAPKSIRRRILLVIAVVSLTAAAALGLGLGLGLGLSGRHKNDTKPSTVQSSTSGSPTTISTPAQPTATDTAVQYSILANTSIAAITPPSGYRHVYFQEKSGAFRQAIYSPHARLWQASTDSSLATGAKSNTPLAVARWMGHRDHPNVSTPSRLCPDIE